MARTEKQFALLTHAEIVDAISRLRPILATLEKAAHDPGAVAGYEIGYKKSLARGIESLAAVEPEIVVAIERARVFAEFGATQVSNKTRPKSVDDLSELVGLGAELPQTVGKRARKAPAPVQRSAKRKAN